jgi:hypothetical protein
VETAEKEHIDDASESDEEHKAKKAPQAFPSAFPQYLKIDPGKKLLLLKKSKRKLKWHQSHLKRLKFNNKSLWIHMKTTQIQKKRLLSTICLLRLNRNQESILHFR